MSAPPRRLWRSRTLRYTLVILAALGGVLLFLLASATSNTPLFERHYPVLFGLNITIAVAMALLIVVLVVRLRRRYRSGVFGTKLMARLALSFALMAVVPGALIYLVSVQFLSRSIESWFDVRVDKALESGLSLGRTALDSLLADVQAKARVMVIDLSNLPETQQTLQLIRLREQAGVAEATLFTGAGRILASASSGSAGLFKSSLAPDMPSSAVLRQLRLTRSYAAIESADENGSPVDGANLTGSYGAARNGDVGAGGAPAERNLRMRVVLPVPSNSFSLLQAEPRFLQILHPVPAALAQHATAVQSGVRDYQELSLSRSGLNKIYSVTLTLTLLLAVFAALAVAFLLSSRLAAPLLFLAAGTKAVAGGDFRPMRELDTKDELGMLTQSFNAMTRQLDEARAAVERNRSELENAKAYLESILANLSAGVLVFDAEFTLVTANQGALRILGEGLNAAVGQRLGAVPALAEFDRAIARAFAEAAAGSASSGSPAAPEAQPGDWQFQFELARAVGDAGGETVESTALTLLAHGSRCPVGGAQGYLVVFDDISDVISAQRSMAWGEVARRLAHEIKNPLTPIQLSAERLSMKLADKLAPNDAAMLKRSVATIVNQVTAMKNMVDDFREYAKAPPAVLVEIDLNALVEEVMGLYESSRASEAPEARSAGEASADAAGPPLRLALTPGLPPIRGDATQLRQVIHNLVQNAQDATHDLEPGRNPSIVLATESVPVRQPDGSEDIMVRLSVTDNGGGFPARILARAFEPYVTTKARGTGLGLAMVKKIADEHDARIDLRNVDGGACVTLLFPRAGGGRDGAAAQRRAA